MKMYAWEPIPPRTTTRSACSSRRRTTPEGGRDALRPQGLAAGVEHRGHLALGRRGHRRRPGALWSVGNLRLVWAAKATDGERVKPHGPFTASSRSSRSPSPTSATRSLQEAAAKLAEGGSRGQQLAARAPPVGRRPGRRRRPRARARHDGVAVVPRGDGRRRGLLAVAAGGGAGTAADDGEEGSEEGRARATTSLVRRGRRRRLDDDASDDDRSAASGGSESDGGSMERLGSWGGGDGGPAGLGGSMESYLARRRLPERPRLDGARRARRRRRRLGRRRRRRRGGGAIAASPAVATPRAQTWTPAAAPARAATSPSGRSRRRGAWASARRGDWIVYVYVEKADS